MAKSGLPTRAEIKDAAMGQRAECVMLNKGIHILEAVKTLSGLLSAEERHYIKKRHVFREFTKQRSSMSSWKHHISYKYCIRCHQSIPFHVLD